MSTTSAFIAAADATLATIGLALDAALETSDADVDWSLNDGILEIECDDGSKLIVNRHVPNREIWVAAKSRRLPLPPAATGAGATRAASDELARGARAAAEGAGADLR